MGPAQQPAPGLPALRDGILATLTERDPLGSSPAAIPPTRTTP